MDDVTVARAVRVLAMIHWLVVFSLFNTGTPKLHADIDRVKTEMLGVPADNVFDAL